MSSSLPLNSGVPDSSSPAHQASSSQPPDSSSQPPVSQPQYKMEPMDTSMYYGAESGGDPQHSAHSSVFQVHTDYRAIEDNKRVFGKVGI